MAALERLTTRINIEMTGDTKKYLVSAKQGDKATRYIIAKLLNDGTAYTIPTGARVAFNVEKPDGKHVYNTCTYSGSEVTVELTNQTLTAVGTAYCDIEVRTSDNTQLITTASFTIEIEKSMRNDDAILSANEFTELEDRIAGHIKNINDTEAAVKKAEAARVTVENKRVAAENIRNQNENTRIGQENLRQQNTAQAVKNAQDATAAADKATKECIKVTKRAEDALQNQEQLEATLNTAVQIRQDVSGMQSAVTAAKGQVERDKEETKEILTLTQGYMNTVNNFSQNMTEATNAANTAASSANSAASAANAGASACQGIVNGHNTMVDTVTHKSCVLSIEDGIITIREA